MTEVSMAVGSGDQAREEILYRDTTTKAGARSPGRQSTREERLAISDERRASVALEHENPDRDQQQSQEDEEEKTD